MNAGRGTVGKHIVVGVKERSGQIKVQKVTSTKKPELQGFIAAHVVTGSTVYSDEHSAYVGLSPWYKHESVNHSIGQYIKGKAHINGMESFWALLKRGYYGVFHKMTWKHLHRYLEEFQARWNMIPLTGDERMDILLASVSGCRLAYERLIR